MNASIASSIGTPVSGLQHLVARPPEQLTDERPDVVLIINNQYASRLHPSFLPDRDYVSPLQARLSDQMNLLDAPYRHRATALLQTIFS